MNPAARNNSEFDRLDAYPQECTCGPAIADISDGPNTEGELSDAQVEAAAMAFWPAYSAAVRNIRSDPKSGITPAQAHKCNVAGMRAALRAAAEEAKQ